MNNAQFNALATIANANVECADSWGAHVFVVNEVGNQGYAFVHNIPRTTLAKRKQVAMYIAHQEMNDIATNALATGVAPLVTVQEIYEGILDEYMFYFIG